DSEATFEGITDNTTWNFTTETPISYTSLFPPDDATDAFQDKELIITFPENIERGTGTLTIYDDTNTDFQSIIATSSKLTISGNKLRVSHDEFNLPASYYVKVPMGFVKSASSGKDFEGISDPTSWNFSTDNLNVWSGGSDTNWNDNGNWDTGSFGAGYNVVLPEGLSNYPEITSSDDISVNSLYIESNAWLTHTGGDLTVDGDFILESSPVDGEQNAAYLPHGGNLTVNGNVQIQQVISDPEGNYYVSPPTDGATMESIGVTDAMVKWNNSTGNYDYLTPSDPLVPGTGYVTRNPDRVVFNGTINTGDVTANVSRSSDGLGWNLIGNPYTASISFEEIDLAGVDSSFWVYRQDLGIYGTYNMGSGDLPPVYTNMPDDNPDLIPSNQSFWIRVNEEETGGSVGFTPDKTFTNAHAYMKSSSQNDSVVKLATNFKGNRDETAVRLTHLAKEEKDRYDSPKKKSANKNYCHIYSHSDHRELAINSMPLKTDTTSINLGIEHNGDPSENCDISLVQNTLPDGYMVLLEDKENGVLVELSDDSPYTYKSDQKGTINDRFVLHLTDVATHANEEISVNQNDNKEKIRIFTNNSQIIAYIDQLNNPAFKLLDVNGRLLKSGQLNANSKNYIPVEHKGVVLFVIESDERTKTFKTVF
ncbi:MAG: Ig-like domain-containing protein, partial [Marinilabiliaceae bacterium]